MDQILLETVVDKLNTTGARLDNQEEELLELSKKIHTLDDQSSSNNELMELVKQLQNNMTAIRWPVREMEKMSERLAQNNELLSSPRTTKKVVFHTAGRLIWVVIGLFIGAILLTIGWIDTSREMEKYRMNDLLWRYTKINQAQSLDYFQDVEKMYISDPGKMESAVEKEELRLKQLDELAKRALEIDPAYSIQKTTSTVPMPVCKKNNSKSKR
jgi:hypothetical protein